LSRVEEPSLEVLKLKKEDIEKKLVDVQKDIKKYDILNCKSSKFRIAKEDDIQIGSDVYILNEKGKLQKKKVECIVDYKWKHFEAGGIIYPLIYCFVKKQKFNFTLNFLNLHIHIYWQKTKKDNK